MGDLLIRTQDFRLAYRLIQRLRARGIDFEPVDHDYQITDPSDVWLATEEEVAACDDGRGVACIIEECDKAIDKALHLLSKTQECRLLAFGIDPGPRPGLAWLSDGRPLGSQQMEDVDDTIDRICELVESVPHTLSVVRIGDGSPTIGARLANVCLARGLRVEMVDERKTSMGVGRHEHSAAALRIARIPGLTIHSKRKVQPSTGEVREVQRRSRRASEGRFTLPIELAQAVAVGRLTMSEALDEYDRRRGTLV